jgi:hypothetical protein
MAACHSLEPEGAMNGTCLLLLLFLLLLLLLLLLLF